MKAQTRLSTAQPHRTALLSFQNLTQQSGARVRGATALGIIAAAAPRSGLSMTSKPPGNREAAQGQAGLGLLGQALQTRRRVATRYDRNAANSLATIAVVAAVAEWRVRALDPDASSPRPGAPRPMPVDGGQATSAPLRLPAPRRRRRESNPCEFE